jgi:hypothetical protein
MDKQKSGLLRRQIEEVLKSSPIGTEYSIELGRGIYSPSNLLLKINFIEKVGGHAVSQAELDWKRHSRSFDLKTEWLGKTFTDKGVVYTIIGLKPARRKYPVLTSYRDGVLLWRTPFIQEKMGEHLPTTAARIAESILKQV